MILDNNLLFSNAQSLATNSSTASNVIDLALSASLSGSTYTAATALNLSWGNASVFGEDLGIGEGIGSPWVAVFTGGTGFSTSNSATLNIQFQTAPDAGGTTISGLTWTTQIETGTGIVMPVAVNSEIAVFQVPPILVGGLPTLPRFWRLNYVLGTGQWTTAPIVTAAVVMDVQAWRAKYYPSNFIAAA